MRSICVIGEQTFGLILHDLFIKTHRLHFWWFPIFICIPLNRFILLFACLSLFSFFLFHFDHHLNLFTWNSFTFFLFFTSSYIFTASSLLLSILFLSIILIFKENFPFVHSTSVHSVRGAGKKWPKKRV